MTRQAGLKKNLTFDLVNTKYTHDMTNNIKLTTVTLESAMHMSLAQSRALTDISNISSFALSLT